MSQKSTMLGNILIHKEERKFLPHVLVGLEATLAVFCDVKTLHHYFFMYVIMYTANISSVGIIWRIF